MSDFSKSVNKMLTQKAVYWAPIGNNGFGKITYAYPVEIVCRWEDKVVLFMNDDGRQAQAKAVIYTSIPLSIEGRLFLGTFQDLSALYPTVVSTADTDLITVDANDLTVDAYFQPTRENAADDTNITVDNIILTADNETLTEAQPEYDPYNTKNIFIIKRFDRSQSLSRPLCFLDKAYLTPYGGMS